MNQEVTIIDHFEILTKYHSGLSRQEAFVISQLTKKGHCIFLETINNNQIVNWHVYAKYESDGQIIAGPNFEEFKQNNYEVED